MKSQKNKVATAYTDGGARGNPGPSAYGFVIIEDDKAIYKESNTIGIATNNVAEYTAVEKALEFLSQEKEFAEVNFYLDSQLVQKQLTGEYKIKNPAMVNFSTKIKELAKNFEKVTYTYIPREENKIADSLVNSALDKE